MGYALAALLGYLVGSSNLAYYLSIWKKKNLQAAGSGNLGASNTTVLLGWKAGAAVAIHDIGKAVMVVYLMGWLFPNLAHIRAVAGVACVLGHIFPFYLRFRGGKGLACYLGMTMVLNWKLAVLAIALLIAVTWVTDYIVCGTMSTITVVPITLGLLQRSWMMALILCIATAVMVYKHRDNFVRMRRGTELGLKSAIRGDNRIS